MPLGKKQLQRLIRLVAQLKENRYPNCVNFADEMRRADIEENLNLACTSKTIARDIRLLKEEFGAPLRFDRAHNGYCLTRRDWNFSCPQIYDDSEMLAAVLGARVAEHIFPEPMRKRIRAAVDYLLAHNNPDFLDTAQMDSLVIMPTNRSRIDAAVFMPLFYAWQTHELCRIDYTSSKGEQSTRDFEPHALIFFDGVWYAKGFCHVRNAMRTLVLSRMTSVVPLGKRFEPDPKIIATANEEGLFDPEMVEGVTVECDEYLTNIISTRPLHPEQKIEALPAGGCRIHVDRMSKYRLITWVMHQCGRATVITPVSCVEAIIEYSEKLSQNHIHEGNYGTTRHWN